MNDELRFFDPRILDPYCVHSTVEQTQKLVHGPKLFVPIPQLVCRSTWKCHVVTLFSCCCRASPCRPGVDTPMRTLRRRILQ